MTDPRGSSEDIDDVAKRIRQAAELQNIIRDGSFFSPFVGRPGPAPASRTIWSRKAYSMIACQIGAAPDRPDRSVIVEPSLLPIHTPVTNWGV